MNRHFFLFFLFMVGLSQAGLYSIGSNGNGSSRLNINEQDTLHGNQILYNGRVWRNNYLRVKEDQFLFSKEFLPGSVTINGKTFNNLRLRYDIYNDEIMIPTDRVTVLQLNKEMVDSFTIIYQNNTYRFSNIREDSVKGFEGFVNVLYNGKSALYVKHIKEIELLAYEKRLDMFKQYFRIYFRDEGVTHHLSGKREFFKLMGEDKSEIKNFIKGSRLKIKRKNPESYIPVIEFYDRMKQ